LSGQIKLLAARLRNLFCVGDFQKRNDDGGIQVKTHNGRVLDKREAFPYGFIAKAKSGRALVFCQGGNVDGFEILPLLKDTALTPPELEEGDAALYTGNGGWVIVREGGAVELYGKDAGGLVKVEELQLQLGRMTARIDGIINALANSTTAAQDGGAAYKTQIVAALNLLMDKEDFTGLASEKVFHGTGVVE
jgi:phage gp45-like